MAEPPPLAPAPSGKRRFLRIAGGVLGAMIGYTAVKLLPHDLGLRIFGGGAAGLLIGLIPFLIGKRLCPRLARAALWSCLGAGMILGLILAVPVGIVFICIILAKRIGDESGA